MALSHTMKIVIMIVMYTKKRREAGMEKDKMAFQVRAAYHSDWDKAMELAWKTFLVFEAPVYKPEGIRSFHDFISDDMLHRMFLTGSYQMFVAFSDGEMRGMITLRGGGHISLLFVDEDYQRRGIGRALIGTLATYMKEEMGLNRMTVNASPYGVAFYHRLGFEDLGPEQEKDGIRYTPMEKLL